jgi:hypothetical protein
MSTLASYLAAKGHQATGSREFGGPSPKREAFGSATAAPPSPSRRDSFPPPPPAEGPHQHESPTLDRRRRSSSSYFAGDACPLGPGPWESPWNAHALASALLPPASPVPSRCASVLGGRGATPHPERSMTPGPVGFRDSSATLPYAGSREGLEGGSTRPQTVGEVAREGHLWMQSGLHWRRVYVIATRELQEPVLQVYADAEVGCGLCSFHGWLRLGSPLPLLLHHLATTHPGADAFPSHLASPCITSHSPPPLDRSNST